ncbi:hypothetical protein [Streptosporangium carneum]|nr:hypothetical protein [Streptosporangium carneum]
MMTPTNSDKQGEISSTGLGRPRRRVPRSLALAAAAVLVASGGVGVSAASAASPAPVPTESGTPTPTPTATVSGTPTETPVPTPTPTPTLSPTPTPTATTAPRVPPVAFPGTLHGEFVLPAKDGCGFTVFTQTGEATAVAEDSITVRSQDGFERTYTVDDSTRILSGRRGNEVRQGDWVSVTSAAAEETATAAYVFDLSRPSRSFWRNQGRWFPKQWRTGGKWRTPTPCPTPSATPTLPPASPPAPTPTDLPTTPPETPTTTPTTPTDTPTTPAPEPTPTATDTAPPAPTPPTP